MITIKGLTKIYDEGRQRVVALQDVSLEIKAGEIFGIIGLSGAGKSTLVRCINMLERPQKGEVIVSGVNMTKLSELELREARKQIGMIFQHFNLLSSRTVYGNVAFPLEIAGKAKAEIRSRVMELLELVGLANKVNAYPSELSGGQKQRVGIARALANDPKVLLCDEATSALDPETTKSVLNLLQDINRKLGITIVMITHEMQVIKEICDRVAVIESGRIVEIGPVLQVFTSPQADATKRLIGGVMDIDIPEELLSRRAAQNQTGKVLLKIGFIGELAGEPVISTLVKECGVTANILFGKIDHIKETPFGTLVVELTGSEEAIAAAMGRLRETGLDTEVIRSA